MGIIYTFAVKGGDLSASYLIFYLCPSGLGV
nr:MAG TPA: hypothetical protein [Crassvirales sp.]DAO41224.1 MAG TPA: hypothetical protein [Crassvirales sp.]